MDVLAVAASPLAVLFRTVRREALPQLVKLNYEAIGSSFFVKCPLHLLRQAVDVGMAVCVNRWGQFSIRGDGYAAISHVRVDTMGLEFNDEKIEQNERGIDYAHFGRIISKAVASSGYEWFWLDLLAVPQTGGDEKEASMLRGLKTNVINSLINVCTNADAVIILDALTLQLPSVDPCIVAAALLSCGPWPTRMWTYQEVRVKRVS